MANKSLFASVVARFLPRTDTINHAGAPAYAYGPEARLAQLAVTGTLNDTYYADAAAQLSDVLEAAKAVDPLFVAKAAIYARSAGTMKDMPALLAAYLTIADPDLSVLVFRRVINTGRMLRTYVQILRSGQVGRRSLGSRPKRLVRQWLEQASIRDLMAAATGNNPRLRDIVRMVHPKPADASREAFYGWLLDRPYDANALPSEIAAFEAWKKDPTLPLPPVPFEWLSSFPLTAEQSVQLADRMGWQGLRMNLNMLARRGVFELDGMADAIAARLCDRAVVQAVRPLPYQVMMALSQLDEAVPPPIHAALEQVLELSLANVPTVSGRVVVCPDVSGSMSSPITGHRSGASSRVRCIDVAALVAAALLRSNRTARVLPFECDVVPVALDPYDPVAVNAAVLAEIGGGGTTVSAPLALLNEEEAAVDLVLIVSDNESWVDAVSGDATQTIIEWEALTRRNPRAKLVCVNLTPYGTTQASGRDDIINVGGFSDAVFDSINGFLSGETRDWVEVVKAVDV